MPCIREQHRHCEPLPNKVSGSNSDRVSRAPVITAKPERVTLSDGSGSTEIDWDTGSGSMGFVFVTEDGGKPVLFASGSRGNQVVPWIGKHSYVFELYRDDQRQTLLAKVTVFRSAESSSPQPKVSWQVVARWALLIGLAAVLYFAVCFLSLPDFPRDMNLFFQALSSKERVFRCRDKRSIFWKNRNTTTLTHFTLTPRVARNSQKHLYRSYWGAFDQLIGKLRITLGLRWL